MDEVIKSYKGFNKDMTCRGKQYEEGKEYEEECAEACECGMHACEHPLDCFTYYAPCESVYHVVEQSGEISRHNLDSKIASTKMKIGAEISIAGLVKAAIEYTRERIRKDKESYENYGASSATGDYGASSATGYYGASSATGKYGASLATGDYGASSATGDYGASSATGDYGASSATGYCGTSSATGYKGKSLATGACGISSSTGDYGLSSVIKKCSVSSANGYHSSSVANNPESIAVAWGCRGRAQGVKGSYLVLADWKCNENNERDRSKWVLKDAKMVQVDGVKIKENTWYTMKHGEIVEANHNECFA